MPVQSLVELEISAKHYALTIFKRVDFHLSSAGASDEDYKKACDAVVSELGRAYAEGYWIGVEDQRRRK